MCTLCAHFARSSPDVKNPKITRAKTGVPTPLFRTEPSPHGVHKTCKKLWHRFRQNCTFLKFFDSYVYTPEKHLQFSQKLKKSKNTKNALFLSARPASGRHPCSRGSSPLQIFGKPGSVEKILDQRPSWTEKWHSTSVPTWIKNREARPHPEDFLKKNEKNAIFSCFLLFYKIFTGVSGEQRVWFLEKSMSSVSRRLIFDPVSEGVRLETAVFSQFSEKSVKAQNRDFSAFSAEPPKLSLFLVRLLKTAIFSENPEKFFGR